jgi:hypothetical protein
VPGISAELDELKEQFYALPNFLTQLVGGGARIMKPASRCANPLLSWRTTRVEVTLVYVAQPFAYISL